MTEDEFRAYVESHPWRFAKTMPKNPHEYTLRRQDRTGRFAEVVQFIRDHGYAEYFFGKPYIMYNCNGYKHWTMGAPVEETILINRKPLGQDELMGYTGDTGNKKVSDDGDQDQV